MQRFASVFMQPTLRYAGVLSVDALSAKRKRATEKGPGSISARLAACPAAHASISTDFRFTSSSAGAIGGACFFDDQDRLAYLGWLREVRERERCSLHAYVLMTNHFHLLLTPQQAGPVPQVPISVGERYAQYMLGLADSRSSWFPASIVMLYRILTELP